MYFVVIKRCLLPINNNGVTAPSMSQGVSKCNVSNRGIALNIKTRPLFEEGKRNITFMSLVEIHASERRRKLYGSTLMSTKPALTAGSDRLTTACNYYLAYKNSPKKTSLW